MEQEVQGGPPGRGPAASEMCWLWLWPGEGGWPEARLGQLAEGPSSPWSQWLVQPWRLFRAIGLERGHVRPGNALLGLSLLLGAMMSVHAIH